MKKKLSALVLLAAMCVTLVSCSFEIPELDLPNADVGGPAQNGQTGTDGTGKLPEDGDTAPDTPQESIPEEAPLNPDLNEWGGASRITHGIAVTVIKDKPRDLCSLVSDVIDTEGAVWQSACPTVVELSGSTATGKKYGRTEVTVTDTSGNSCVITVTVEFLTSSNNGYSFTSIEDKTVYSVKSVAEADRLLDKAIVLHVDELTIDFSSIDGYNAFEEYNGSIELSSHISITKRAFENEPNLLYLDIDYKTDTASTYTEATADNTYNSLTSANMLIRQSAAKRSEFARSDDFNAFPIELENNGTLAVYNSEELWWALQYGYKPTFPMQSSKAELFYERAKMILRDIVTENMSDAEKVLAIYEYLVDCVAYDYDAYEAEAGSNYYTDVCYYLEGVFERGRAVCDGKSKAFVLLCGIEGISCVRDFGDSKTGGAGHAWNYVMLDGMWYLVDTTSSDAAYGTESGFGSYLGKGIELTTYDMFLTDISAHRDDYEYSGIFSDVYASASDSISAAFLTLDIHGSEYDFVINSEEELSEILTRLMTEGTVEECALAFVLDENVFVTDYDKSNVVFNTTETVIANLGSTAEFTPYTVTFEGTKLYYLVIKSM